MKTILKWCLPLFMLAVVSGLFSSCEKSSDVDEEGVITLKVRNANNGKTTIPFEFEEGGSISLYIDYDNNFSFCYNSGGVSAQICDVGKKKMSAVKNVPSAGWAGAVAALSSHSYVIKCTKLLDYETKKTLVKYYKLYVVDSIEGTSGGILGWEVKYCEWNPK